MIKKLFIIFLIVLILWPNLNGINAEAKTWLPISENKSSNSYVIPFSQKDPNEPSPNLLEIKSSNLNQETKKNALKFSDKASPVGKENTQSKITQEFIDFEKLSREIYEVQPIIAKQKIMEHAAKYKIDLDRLSALKDEIGDLIHIKDNKFIPQPGIEDKLLRKINLPDAPANIIVLIQFKSPSSLKQLVDLLSLDIHPFYWLNNKLLIAQIEKGKINELAKLSFIRWAGEYEVIYKYTNLDKEMAQGMQDKEITVFLFLLSMKFQNSAIDLQSMGIQILNQSDDIFTVRIRASDFMKVANLPWVRQVSIEKEKVILSHEAGLGFQPDDSREIINAPQVWKTLVQGNYVRGYGVKTGVMDTGIWNGHPDFPSGTLLNYVADNDGHGTHVAGIIASRGTRDLRGAYEAKGVANEAKLYAVYYETPIGPALNEFKTNSVKIVNNSWSYNIDRYNYNENTEIIDRYVDQDKMTLIFAAGNDGWMGASTIRNPATAKNVISVGSISYTSQGYSRGIGNLAWYSSRGPTRDDLRLKPDVVAPGGDTDVFLGNSIYGVVSMNAQNATGGWIDNPINRWPADSYYTRMHGTSMAAPHVTGIATLMQQVYKDYFNGTGDDGFSPRDIKGLLLANALPLKGYGTFARNGYASNEIGYGLVDAFYSILDPYSNAKKTALWGHGGVSYSYPSQTWPLSARTVNNQVKQLRVVLTYEDLAGEINNENVLKDNLDLTLISSNGNEFTFTYATGTWREGPEEVIVIDDPYMYGAGEWTIRINGRWWNSPSSSQRYTVIAVIKKDAPVLNISPLSSNWIVIPNENFNVLANIKNVGDLTAAGITSWLTAPAGFSGEINHKKFVGNLIFKNDEKLLSFSLRAPSATGSYNIQFNASAINKNIISDALSTIQIIVKEPSTFERIFYPGWNMYSFPFYPAPSSIHGQFDDDITEYYAAYHYNNTTRSYDTTDVADIALGYWTKVNNNYTVDMQGISTSYIYIFPIPLGSGWNQIGNPFNATIYGGNIYVKKGGITKTIWDAINAGWVSGTFYPYDTLNKQYISINPIKGVLNPGEGYWFKAIGSGSELLIPYYTTSDNFFLTYLNTELPRTSWSVQITSSQGQAFFSSTYSTVVEGATIEYDISDAPMAVSPPEAPVIQSYFPHISWTEYPDNYIIDARPETASINWNFEVQSNSLATVTLTWDVSQAPSAYKTVQLQDGVTGQRLVADMRTATSYWYLPASATYTKSFNFVVDTRSERVTTLYYRNNMVSIPLDTVPADFQAQFGDDVTQDELNSIARFNTYLNQYEYWADLHYPPVIGTGYWITLDANKEVDSWGDLAASANFTIHLVKGRSKWNLIGHPFDFTVNWADAMIYNPATQETVSTTEAASRGWIGQYLYYWNPSTNMYNSTTELWPWYGYWVIANIFVDLIIPPTPAGQGLRGGPAGQTVPTDDKNIPMPPPPPPVRIRK